MIKTFVLILLVTQQNVRYGDSIAISSIGGFSTKQECVTAGTQATATLFDGRFVCVEQTVVDEE